MTNYFYCVAGGHRLLPVPLPPGPKCSQFHVLLVFFGKFVKIVFCRPPPGSGGAPSYRESWIRPCVGKYFARCSMLMLHSAVKLRPFELTVGECGVWGEGGVGGSVVWGGRGVWCVCWGAGSVVCVGRAGSVVWGGDRGTH